MVLKRIRKKEIFITTIVIVLFIVSSYFSHLYSKELGESIFLKSSAGEISYILISALGVLVAPVSTTPLLPIAVSLWGANMAAIFTIIGWSTGALLAFVLARYLGRKIICRFVDMNNIEKWSLKLPARKLFWFLVLARLILPVDVISYAVGLFTKMRWTSYLLATVLGTTVFAFVFAHGSQLPISLQAFAGIAILFLIVFGYGSFRGWSRLHSKKEKY